MKNKTLQITKSALIAALYIVLGLIFKSFDFGAIQLRPSEAMNILIYYTSSAPLGLFIGCIINNLASPFGIIDIAIGSVTTLVAALLGRKINNKFLCVLPAVVLNAFSVPFVLCFASGTFEAYYVYFLQIAGAQFLSVYCFGLPLSGFIDNNKKIKEFISDK